MNNESMILEKMVIKGKRFCKGKRVGGNSEELNSIKGFKILCQYWNLIMILNKDTDEILVFPSDESNFSISLIDMYNKIRGSRKKLELDEDDKYYYIR